MARRRDTALRPIGSRILEGLTLTIENALARLHRACNPAARALRR